MERQKSIHISEEEKIRHRLSLSYTERFRAAMKMLRLKRKLQSAKIIYPAKDLVGQKGSM